MFPQTLALSIFRPAIFRQMLVVLVMLPFGLRAQEHQEIGISGGMANYYCDLQPSIFPTYGYKPMGGIIYKYFMNPYIGIRTGASYTNLTASDELSNNAANKARNLSFSTQLYELHGALEINFLPVEVKKKHCSPYIFGGISVFYFNPTAVDPQGNTVYLKPLSTEGEGLSMYPDRKSYSLVNVAFPFGGGLKFFIGKTIMLGFELGYRYTNTDYLDDVSKSYVNLNSLQAAKGPVAAQMSYRGNTAPGWNGIYPNYGSPRGDATSNDWYWFGNLTVTFFFRKPGETGEVLKTDCPKLFK